jgi:glutamine amidotransferase
VAAFAADLRPLGPANFLYSDGDAVFVHGHRRTHAGSPSPRPPGLHVLCRTCTTGSGGIDTTGLRVTAGGDQSVVLAASVPLTTEPGWRALDEGALVVAHAGRIVAMC